MNTHSIQTNTHLKTKSKSQTSTHTNLEPKTPKPQEIDYSRVGDWNIKSLKATTSSPAVDASSVAVAHLRRSTTRLWSLRALAQPYLVVFSRVTWRSSHLFWFSSLVVPIWGF
jgi:hypothetical protein